MERFWERVRAQSMSGEGMGGEDALAVLSLRHDALQFTDVTESVRRRFKGDEIRLCSIVNAKSGLCSEDCSFCAQSRRSGAGCGNIRSCPWRRSSGRRGEGPGRPGVLHRRFRSLDAEPQGAGSRGGRGGTDPEGTGAGDVCEPGDPFFIERGVPPSPSSSSTTTWKHASLGEVCAAHDYEEDVTAVRAAKAAGAWVCCGRECWGSGESREDRVELAITLRELQVDSIPVNFCDPRPRHAARGRRELTPLEGLRIIAMLRLTNPTREIIVCGGREVNAGTCRR